MERATLRQFSTTYYEIACRPAGDSPFAIAGCHVFVVFYEGVSLSCCS